MLALLLAALTLNVDGRLGSVFAGPTTVDNSHDQIVATITPKWTASVEVKCRVFDQQNRMVDVEMLQWQAVPAGQTASSTVGIQHGARVVCETESIQW